MSIESLKLINALLDNDNVIDNIDEAEVLLKSFIDNDLLVVMIENLKRIKETNEKENIGIYYTFSIIESILEIQPQIAIKLCNETNIFTYIIKYISVKDMDENKLYSSEILSSLLSNNNECVKIFLKNSNKENLYESLLKCINVWKKKDPSSPEEQEFIENLFDSLCALLVYYIY